MSAPTAPTVLAAERAVLPTGVPTTRACPSGWGRSGVLRHQLAAQRAIAFLQGTGYAARRAAGPRAPGAAA